MESIFVVFLSVFEVKSFKKIEREKSELLVPCTDITFN